MHASSLMLLGGLATQVAAFFPYLPKNHTGAPRLTHASDSISKAFAFAGPEIPLNEDDKLSKAPWKHSKPKNRKRSSSVTTKAKHLTKRLNDFVVEKGDQPDQSKSSAIDQDGTDFSYFAEVTIGGNTVYMLLDTGSSAMWVMGKDCESDACHTHSLSSLDQTTNDDFSLSYSSGEVTGTLGQDTMQFAGMTLDVTMGLADTTSDDFDKYPMDGILGLARTANGTDYDGPTFLETVQKAGALEANVFGIWLDRAKQGPKNGEISFGAPDTSRFTGQLNYIDTDMEDTSIWKIPATDVMVNGKSVGLSNRQAVIDTGTTYMFVPPQDADAIFAQVPGASLPGGADMYNVPCDTSANISFVFNNVAYEISPKDYVGPSVSGSDCYTHIIGMAAVEGDESTWLLGDTFLKNVYTVFDADKNRVGFGIPSISAETGQSGGTSGGAGGGASSSNDSGDGQSSSSNQPPNGMVGGNSQGSGSDHASGGPDKASEDAMGSIGNGASLASRPAGLVVLAAGMAAVLVM